MSITAFENFTKISGSLLELESKGSPRIGDLRVCCMGDNLFIKSDDVDK